MENKTHRRKSVYLLPNSITSLSLLSGFMAIIWASAGRFETAALAIIFSALMDGLDGKVARLTNTASEFGIQYDSLADLVAFGVAPSLLMWHWQLHSYERIGIAICFIFTACTALRLARFNVSTAVTNKKFFIGLPSPAAGCSAISLVFFAQFIPSGLSGIIAPLTLVFTLILGILMVSRVRYYSFKEYAFLRAHPFSSLVTTILLIALLASQPKLLGFVVVLVYISTGIFYTFVILPRRNRDSQRGQPLQENK